MAKDCFARVSGNQNGFVPGYPPKGPSSAEFANNGCVSNGQFMHGLMNMQTPPHFVSQGQGAYSPSSTVSYPLGYGPNGPLLNAHTSSQVSPPEQTNNVRPIREKQVKTCIEVEYKGETISALLDTGSDVSIAGDDVARRFGWKVHEHPTKSVKMANDEDMTIHGAARIPLCVGSRKITSEILITPDLNGLIIGIDRMRFRFNSPNFISPNFNSPNFNLPSQGSRPSQNHVRLSGLVGVCHSI